MRRLLGVGLATLCLAAAATAPAAEAGLVATVADLQQGPRFAGERIAWLESTSSRYTVRAAIPGADPITLTKGTLDGDYEREDFVGEEGVDFAVSASRLVLLRSAQDWVKGYLVSWHSALDAAPLGAGLAPLESCSGGGFGFELDGDVLAEAVCAGRLRIRDLASSAVPLDLEQYAVRTVRIAGRYVAFQIESPGQIVVYDRQTQTIAYTVDHDPYPATPADFDVGPDGTLAVVWSKAVGCGSSVTVHTPTRPAGRLLPVRSCRAFVRMAAGRLALSVKGAGNRQMLAVSDLDGHLLEAADLGTAATAIGEIDFDGARVAYALRSCDGRTELRVAALDQPGPPARQRLECPFRTRTRRARVGRGGAASVRIACPLGCQGRASIALRGRATQPFAVGPSKRPATVRIVLSRSARRLLRARHRLSATLTVSVADRAGKRRTARRRLWLLTR